MTQAQRFFISLWQLTLDNWALAILALGLYAVYSALYKKHDNDIDLMARYMWVQMRRRYK